MLKLLIVDDEYLIRQYIRNCVDWEEIGYTIVGELGSAQGALRLAEELKPDVVLTDICMPGLDGLSFAGLLKDKCPGVRIVAVTGYDDFEYAQRGIRVGLDNYLLKPIDKEELTRVALELKESIFSKRNREDLFRELADYKKQNEPVVREYYLRILLESEFHQESMTKKNMDFLLPGKGGFYQTAVLCIDDFSQILLENQVKKGNAEWLEEYLKRHLEGRETAWMRDKFDHVVLFCCEEQFPWEQFMQELSKAWKDAFHYPVYYGIGEGEQSIQQLYKSYIQANNYLNSAIAFGNNQFQREKNASRFESMVKPVSMEELKKLYTYIETNSQGKLEKLIEDWFETWKNRNLQDLFYLKLQLVNAVFYIYSRNTQDDGSCDFQKEYKEYYRQIFQIPTLKLLKECFLEMCKKMLDSFHEDTSVRPSGLIFAVKEYIRTNLSDTELSLSGTAEKFFLNSSYLSRIFKQEAGVSFIEYVNALRIEKAKGLLKDTDLKIYEIAERVGVENANYLGILFKKTVGCSPYEYRNKK